MRSFFALAICALVLSIAQPSFAQTATAPSPAPFTAPANWVQMPRGFTLTEFKNLWQGAKSGKTRAGIFGQAVLPVPAGFVGAGIAQLKSILSKPSTPPKSKSKSKSKAKAKASVSNQFSASTVPATLCGGKASISTIRFGQGTSAAILEIVVLSKNGLTYASAYARPNGGAANSTIETTMRTSCPLPNGDLADAVPPAGFAPVAKGLEAELAGIWLGNSPWQIIILLQGHGIPSPNSIADMVKPTTVMKNGQMQSRVSVKRVKFCGDAAVPGILVNAQGSVPPGFGISSDLAAVQGTNATYLLWYFHPSDYNDQSAQQSLLTLCGGVPPPESTATPSPSPGKS
ncbi:MAG TPA: hypothetical protein VFO29_08980 [Candidatus Rubrimentiphilum sp.]|nr:hypothetical protein [Candidatus Rubrimentiphilum sp.]